MQKWVRKKEKVTESHLKMEARWGRGNIFKTFIYLMISCHVCTFQSSETRQWNKATRKKDASLVWRFEIKCVFRINKNQVQLWMCKVLMSVDTSVRQVCLCSNLLYMTIVCLLRLLSRLGLLPAVGGGTLSRRVLRKLSAKTKNTLYEEMETATEHWCCCCAKYFISNYNIQP